MISQQNFNQNYFFLTPLLRQTSESRSGGLWAPPPHGIVQRISLCASLDKLAARGQLPWADHLVPSHTEPYLIPMPMRVLSSSIARSSSASSLQIHRSWCFGEMFEREARNSVQFTTANNGSRASTFLLGGYLTENVPHNCLGNGRWKEIEDFCLRLPRR